MTSRDPQPVHGQPAPGWLQTPLGQALLEAETHVLTHALDGVFGEHLLQIGRWGDEAGWMAQARTQHASRVFGPGEGGDVAADFTCLPFDSGSVDAVLLPHTLDLTTNPHDVLRESHRVLRSEGRILLLGFKSFGLWGLRRLWSRHQFPPGMSQVLGDRVLRDWLQLLDLRVYDHQRFFFRLPLTRLGQPASANWEQRGKRWWPELAACYLLHARKRVAAVTPVMPRWRARARVVGGVAEPSLRKVVELRRARKPLKDPDPL